MSFLPAPSAQTWWTLFGSLACDAGALGLLALLFEWRFKAPRARRAIWQAAFVSLACCLLLEVTGLSHGLSAWVFPAQTRPAWQLNADFRARVLRSLSGSVSASVAVQTTTGGATTAGSSTPSLAPFPRAWLPGLLWLAGIGLVLVPAAGGRLLLARLCRRGSPARTSGRGGDWPRLAGAAGCRRNVLLLILPSLKSPIAFGFFRPVVGLPKDFFEGFTPGEQEAILAHELAHLAAGDPAWKLFSDLVRAAFWWHPVVWWGKHRFSAASEMAADETSAEVTHRPAALAECLVRLGGRALGSHGGGLSVRGSGFRSGLGQRVTRLLDLEQTSEGLMPGRARAPLRVIVTGFFVITLLTSAGTSQALERRALPGDQTMQNRNNHHWWNKSLAHFILLAALAPAAPSAPVAPAAAPEAPAPVPPPAIAAPPSDPNPQIAPGLSEQMRARYGLGPMPFAPGTPPPPTGMSEAMRRRYGLGSHPSAAPPPFAEEPTAPTAPPEEGQPVVPFGWSVEMYKRYGLPIPPGLAGGGAGKTPLESKLESIQLDEVRFDGLPLSEVIQFLIQETTRLDAGKRGVNFIVSNRDGRPPGFAVDPTTGQTISTPEGDLNDVQIRIKPPLRHVSLVNVLDAITKVSDRPLKYTIEPYGVIFSHGSPAMEPGAAPAEPLMVRTFQVDPGTILGNLLRVFPAGALTGRLPSPGGSPSDSAKQLADLKIQPLLREMLIQLGVGMNPPKTIFYNGGNGVVLVRASASDFDLIEAAFKMLSEPGQGPKALPGGGGIPPESQKPRADAPGSLPASSPVSTGGTITVLGEVKRPGNFSLTPDKQWTIVSAIAEAGAFTDKANINTIELKRENAIRRLSFRHLLEGTNDLKLQSGDIVHVPATFF